MKLIKFWAVAPPPLDPPLPLNSGQASLRRSFSYSVCDVYSVVCRYFAYLQEAIAITNGSVVVVYEVSGDVIRAAGK